MDKQDNQRNTHRMGRYGYAGNAIARSYVGKSHADSIRLGYAGGSRRGGGGFATIGIMVVGGLIALALFGVWRV